ncbi:MAG TPA: hypothetical protein VF020_16435 [Chthoniobacterales bacterium]
MSQPPQRSGCGCCGCLGCLGTVVLVLVLAVAALVFLLYQTASSDRPSRTPSLAANQEVYVSAKKKWDDFNRDGSIRVLTLSDAEINALLAKAPELGFLAGGATVTSRENGIQLQLSVPVKIIPFYTKYINADVFLRPIITGENVDLNIYGVDAEGRPLDAASLQRFKSQAQPAIDAILTGVNQWEGPRAIHEIRLQNGSVALLR